MRQTTLSESVSADSEKHTQLNEAVNARLTSDRVDRDAGVIRDVKILGKDSVNNRIYHDAAIRKAVVLYEGCTVRIDHKPEQSDRPLIDDIGVLKNVKMKDDGVYGDFYFIKSHPLAEMVCEKAERFPENFGFSHKADGLTNFDASGVMHVLDLRSVESVDLVGKPATNKSLFESIEPKTKEQKMRKRSLLEMEMDDEVEMEKEKIGSAKLLLEDEHSAGIQAIIDNTEMSDADKLDQISMLIATPKGDDGDLTEDEDFNEDDDVEIEIPEEEDDYSTTDLKGVQKLIASIVEPMFTQISDKIAEIQTEISGTKTKLTESDNRQSIMDRMRYAGIENPCREDIDIAMMLKGGQLTHFLESISSSSAFDDFVPRSSGQSTRDGLGAYPSSTEQFANSLRH